MSLASTGGNIERGLRTAALWIALLLLTVLVAVCLWQVIARFVLIQSTPWTEGVARGAMLWAVFLGLPAAFDHGAMVTLDLFKRLPERMHRIFAFVAGLGSCVVLALATFYGVKMLGIVRYQTLAGLGVSIGWIYAAVPVGCAIAIPTVLRRTLRELQGRGVKEELEAFI